MPAQPNPDFEGFADAQVRLRQQFGQDVIFYSGGSASYASGVSLNDDGVPFDPSIKPIASGKTATTVRVSLVNRPMGLSRRGIDNTVERQAIGWLEAGGIVAIVDAEDWHLLADAEEAQWADEYYAIRQSDHDFLGPVDRYLLYMEQK